MRSRDVSPSVARRIPRYYRYLDELYRSGVERISSKALAERMDITASQVRQDFNCYGGFGQQGYGYRVEHVREQFAEILGLNKGYRAVVIGVGNIGRALLSNFSFEKHGFILSAAFDKDERVVGTQAGAVRVLHIDELEDFARHTPFDAAALALPREAAPAMASRLAALHVRGIWNFTNIDLNVDGLAAVENVHFSDSLMTLCHRITK